MFRNHEGVSLEKPRNVAEGQPASKGRGYQETIALNAFDKGVSVLFAIAGVLAMEVMSLAMSARSMSPTFLFPSLGKTLRSHNCRARLALRGLLLIVACSLMWRSARSASVGTWCSASVEKRL